MDDRYHGPLPRSEADKELIEDLMRNIDASLDEGSSYLDLMFAAFIRTTDLHPEEVAMVQQYCPWDDTTVTYFIRRADLDY